MSVAQKNFFATLFASSLAESDVLKHALFLWFFAVFVS